MLLSSAPFVSHVRARPYLCFMFLFAALHSYETDCDVWCNKFNIYFGPQSRQHLQGEFRFAFAA